MSETPARYAGWIGGRYLRTRRDSRFVSFVSGIAMLGIAIGVMVLIVVLSVMNGFERTLQGRILDVTSHATLEGIDGPLGDWRTLAATTRAAPGARAVAPFVAGRAMLVAGDRTAGVEFRGVDPAAEARVSALGSRMIDGRLEALRAGEYGIVLGKVLAEALAVGPGDRVTLMVAEGNVTPAGMTPRMRRFTVVGRFDAGMYEFDRGLALLQIDDARRLLRLGEAVTGLRYAIDDPLDAPRWIHALAVQLGGGFLISDWTRSHVNFFRSIQITRSILFTILLLVVGVAAFNIVSTLVMVVKDKQGDIAILRTLGASPGEVLQVFLVQGAAIGLVGTALGVAAGVLLALNITVLVHGLEALLGITLVDAQVYFIDELPADVRPGDVLRIALTALALGVLSTLYPAWRAARTAPAEALRHEV
jgi:lipoprotein-releasing system permease protein